MIHSDSMPKVKVDKELLIKVAENARLKLTEQEIKEFLPQFKEVLDSFSALDKVDSKNEKPSFQPIRTENVFREDILEKCLSQDEALSNSKNNKAGYIKGPRVV